MTEDEMNRIADLVVEKLARRLAGAAPVSQPAIPPVMFPQPAPTIWPSFAPDTDQRMPGCGCRMGTICMNAACPNGVRITC